jgi:hypothetical protein
VFFCMLRCMKAEEFVWNWLEASIGTIETEEDQNCMRMLAKQTSPPIWVDVVHAISSK